MKYFAVLVDHLFSDCLDASNDSLGARNSQDIGVDRTRIQKQYLQDARLWRELAA